MIPQMDKSMSRLAYLTAKATGRARADFPEPLKAHGEGLFLQALEQGSARLRTTVATRITIE